MTLDLWAGMGQAAIQQTRGDKPLCGFHHFRIQQARIMRPRNGGALAVIFDFECTATNNPRMNIGSTYSVYLDSGQVDVFPGQIKSICCAVYGIDKNTAEGRQKIQELDQANHWPVLMKEGVGTLEEPANGWAGVTIANWITPQVSKKGNHFRRDDWQVADTQYPPEADGSVPEDIPEMGPAPSRPAMVPQAPAAPGYPPAAPAAPGYPPAAPAAPGYPPAAPAAPMGYPPAAPVAPGYQTPTAPADPGPLGPAAPVAPFPGLTPNR